MKSLVMASAYNASVPSRDTFDAVQSVVLVPLVAAVSNRDRMRWSRPAKAPLTMKRM